MFRVAGVRFVNSTNSTIEDGRSSCAGFSLLELVIVLLLMGLVAAVSYPSLSRGSASLNLKATGRDVLNTLRYAREKAITEQHGMRIVVDREKGQVRLTDDFGDGERVYQLPDDIRIERLASAGRDLQDGPLAIRFRPNGSAESAEILLVSRTGLSLRVVTDPVTGGARIYSGRGEVNP
jgi:general secretion pathway protein H